MVQFNWGTPDGFKTIGGAGWAYDVMAYAGFPYQNSNCWGKFLVSEKGNLAAELVEEGLPPQEPLPLTFSYDLPEDGEVTIQLVDAAGWVKRILVAQGKRRAGKNVERFSGLDDSGRPLAAGDYRWKGLYHQGITTKFLFSAHNSGRPPHKVDDGSGGWGGDHGVPTSVCAAGDAMVLAWNGSESGSGLIRTGLDGKKRWGVLHNAEDLASDGERIFVCRDYHNEGQHSVRVFAVDSGRPLNWGNGKLALERPAGAGSDVTAAGVAYGSGRVFVSWPDANSVCAYDAKSGALEETWPVPAPARLAARGDGVAVISAGKLLAVSKAGTQPLASEKLDDPRGIAIDAAGNLYVANAGKLQNVSVFDKTGRYLRSIGKPGGRPAVGRYDSQGIYMPGGIAVSKDGKLWVAETTDSPKRHSVWDAASGAFVTEYFGASSYFGWASLDPKHADEMFCHNVLWKIDWQKNAVTPHSTVWRSTAPNMLREANPGGYAGHWRVMTAKNGHQYGWGMADYSNMLSLRVGDVFKPIAGSVRLNSGQYGSPRYPALADTKKYPDGPYLWQDKNDDQTIQEDEITKSPADRGEGTFNWIDSELNVWCEGGFLLRPARIEADGRPVYDFSKFEKLPFTASNSNCASWWLDPRDESNLYVLDPAASRVFGRFTRDKKLVWGFADIIPWNQAISRDMGTPGKLFGLTMPLGVAGDFTGAACYAGPYYLFTTDGVYVSMIMRNGRDGRLGPDITASETLTGQLVKPEGMNRYFLLAGDQDGRVTEVLGLDKVKRLPGGTFTLSSTDVQKVAAEQRDYLAALSRRQRLSIARGKSGLSTAAPVSQSQEDGRSFAIKASYDAEKLYVEWDVSGSDLVNSYADTTLLFKGGNCLDVQLATDRAADPKREKPAGGDLRLLVSRQLAGKQATPIAMLYRPKVAGFAGQPTVLRSPTGSESFDAIERLDAASPQGVQLEYQKSNAGFKATLSVPLKTLGLALKPGDELLMDVGYIFGNATGTQAALRGYWSNHGFSAGITNDVPNESRLEPKLWGKASVE